MKKKISLIVLVIALIIISVIIITNVSNQPVYSRNIKINHNKLIFSELGIAPTPKNFPNHKKADIDDMFKKSKIIGDYAVFIYQWSNPDHFELAKKMIMLCDKYKLTPIIAISPTILKGSRDKIDVPDLIRNKTKNNLSFSNPDVNKAYINAVIELAKLKPPYLCLATEINFLALKNSQEYIYYAKIYKDLYPIIKNNSPQTKVFVSFQWDYIKLIDDKLPNKRDEHKKLINIFRPQLDLIAFTTYPSDHFNSVSVIPPDYYTKINSYVNKDDEIMFMEIGWPAKNTKSNQEQLLFINKLPDLMNNLKPKFIIWSLLHDVNSNVLSNNLSTTGLIKNDGKIKPAFESFIKLKK